MGYNDRYAAIASTCTAATQRPMTAFAIAANIDVLKTTVGRMMHVAIVNGLGRNGSTTDMVATLMLCGSTCEAVLKLIPRELRSGSGSTYTESK